MQSLTGLLNEKGIETTIVDANDRGVFMKVIISIYHMYYYLEECSLSSR